MKWKKIKQEKKIQKMGISDEMEGIHGQRRFVGEEGKPKECKKSSRRV